MESNLLIEAERAALLAEIASLEQQIASLNSGSSDEQARPPKRPRPAEPTESDHDIKQTIRDLLASNDSALRAAHPPKPKDFEDEEQGSAELERAYELLQANAAFTGIELTEADSTLLNVGEIHQIREHILIGTLPSPYVPLGFRMRLTVREPVIVGEVDPSAPDPGSEYEVESAEAEVWGGGAELQEAIRELRLATRPNPPAFFARLREYSLLAAQRHEMFDSLRISLSEVLQDEGQEIGTEAGAESGSAEDSLSFSAGIVTLIFTHTIAPSQQTGSLAPNLSLDPVMSPAVLTLPDRARSLLLDIPQRYSKMLAEGFDPLKATELMVKAALGKA